MSGHDDDDIRDGNANTGNDNRVDGLEFFHPDWNKYFELGNKPFDEFTQSVKVAIPSNTLLCKYHKIVSTLYDKIQHLLIENQELASLRDFLLPMLMNGQVTFKESK